MVIRLDSALANREAANMKAHPLTLQFPGQIEDEFLEDYFEKSIVHIRIALIVGIIVYGGFGLIDIWLLPSARSPLWFLRYGICLIAIATLRSSFLAQFRQYSQPLLSLMVALSGLVLLALGMVADPSIRDDYHAGLLLLLSYSHTLIKLRFIYATAASLLMTIASTILDFWILHVPTHILFNSTGYLLTANIIGMFASYSAESYMRKDFIHDRTLKWERDRSDRLLLNILPHPIAQKLKQAEAENTDYTIADSFTNVTVLFADIEGFTKLSEQVAPVELVSWLNQIFSHFDRLAEKHGLEKIKTIGDAYMVVGGLPLPRADHAEAIADMAIEMQQAVDCFTTTQNAPFKIRIGINTGPVVAGVIGIKKFIYDLWGDTVNTASRMESHGIAGCIQVTATTFELLQEKYLFEERGAIAIKGKGEMIVYFLKGRKIISLPRNKLL
jgi:class 3 adenylate cyclase